jgi:tetratricopeptide (TPR) repeat protein
MIKLKAVLATPPKADERAAEPNSPILNAPPTSPSIVLAGQRAPTAFDPEVGQPDTDAAIEILEAASDRFAAGDLAAVRVAAAQLRRKFPDHPDVLREAGRCWIQGESPAEAIADLKRSLQLDPEQAEVWFLLALAHRQLSDTSACMSAAEEASKREPDNRLYAAFTAAVEAQGEAAWRRGLSRLIDLYQADPGDEDVKGLLAETYMFHASKGWTVVKDDERGGAVVETTKKILRIATGTVVEPGIYPTEAIHVNTAAICLARLQALNLKGPEWAANIADIDRVVRAGNARTLNATWGEIAISVIFLIGGLMLFGQNAILALLALLMSAAMFIGSYSPQYRINRNVLSKRGDSIGGSALTMIMRHNYGGIFYTVFLMGAYPFVAMYKVYVNWAQGWMAKPEIASVTGSASLQDASRSQDLDLSMAGPHEPISESAVDQSDAPASAPAAPLALAEVETTAVSDREVRSSELVDPEVVKFDEAAPDDAPASESISQADREVEAQPTSNSGAAAEPAAQVVAHRVASPPPLFAGPAQRLPSLPPIAWAGIAVAMIGIVGLGVWATLRPNSAPAAAATDAQQASSPAAPARPAKISGAPTIIDTGTLAINGVTVALDGIDGEGGNPAEEMARFIATQGGTVSCEGLPNGLYRCMTPSEYDVAAAALFNGGARISTGASEKYRKMQADAQAAKKGIWQ